MRDGSTSRDSDESYDRACDRGARSDRTAASLSSTVTQPVGTTPGNPLGHQLSGATPSTANLSTGDGPAVVGSLAWATWALFVGLSAMLAGAGLFGTLIGVRGDLEGFPVSVNGLISAAYYAGFLLGSRLALRALGQVGHIRVYAALRPILSRRSSPSG